MTWPKNSESLNLKLYSRKKKYYPEHVNPNRLEVVPNAVPYKRGVKKSDNNERINTYSRMFNKTETSTGIRQTETESNFQKGTWNTEVRTDANSLTGSIIFYLLFQRISTALFIGSLSQNFLRGICTET